MASINCQQLRARGAENGGTLNGNAEAAPPKFQNGFANSNGVANVKEEVIDLDQPQPEELKNGNGVIHKTARLSNRVEEVEDVLMNGIEDIKISDSMDVDDDGDVVSKHGVANGGNLIASMAQVPGSLNNGGNLAAGVASGGNHDMKVVISHEQNGVSGPHPNGPKCGNTPMCELLGSPNFPCKRCHKVFYCNDEHRQHHFNTHQPDCKTVSCLEVINYEDDYSMWLKHAAPHLYDTCLNFVLVWPSLTVQWLPEITERDNNTLRHHLLIGTMTNQEQNHLLICGIDVPDRSKTEGFSEHNNKYKGTLYVEKRINHEAEVNRARYMPQDYNIIATKSSSPEVFIFDVRKYPEVPEDSTFSPLIRLRGHQKEGFGLSWNLKDKGTLLSGSDDSLICLWDVNKNTVMDNNVRYITASRTFRAHEDVVEDVDWHPEQRNIFASVGDDKRLILWDTRVAVSEEAVHISKDAHHLDINAVSFSPFIETCLATCSSDSTVAVWDMRNMNQRLHSLEFHQAEVMQVQWSPHTSSMLASTGKDNRVFVWDLAKAGKGSADMQQPAEDDPAPAELAFIHGGHIANVNDISWNMHDMGMIASVTEDNILQVWKISEDLQAVYKGDDDSDNESAGSASEAFDD